MTTLRGVPAIAHSPHVRFKGSTSGSASWPASWTWRVQEPLRFGCWRVRCQSGIGRATSLLATVLGGLVTSDVLITHHKISTTARPVSANPSSVCSNQVASFCCGPLLSRAWAASSHSTGEAGVTRRQCIKPFLKSHGASSVAAHVHIHAPTTPHTRQGMMFYIQVHIRLYVARKRVGSHDERACSNHENNEHHTTDATTTHLD